MYFSDLETNPDNNGQANDIIDFVEDQHSTSSVESRPVEDDPDFVQDIGPTSMASGDSGQVSVSSDEEHNADLDFDKDGPSTSYATSRSKAKTKKT